MRFTHLATGRWQNMDASAAGPPPASSPHLGRRHDAAVPGLPYGPGWLVLRDCPLGGGGSPVDLALLHPKIGVALVAFADAGADAPERLRRALDARRFPAIFGGYPPIVRVVVPADRLADLGHILSARFRAQPPASLEGGDAWVPTVRAALEAGPAADDSAATGAPEENVASWWMTLLVLGSAVSIGVLAAVAVIPAPLDPGGMPAPPQTTAAAPPQKRGDAPPAGAPPSKPPPAGAEQRAAEPEAVAFRPVPETRRAAPPHQRGDATPAGAAAVQQEDAGSPSPAAAVDGERAGPWLPAPAWPAAPPTAADPVPDPPLPMPFQTAAAPTVPEPQARMRSAGAGTPARSASTAAARATPAASEGERCRAILVRTTLGEGISYEDKEHLRRRCQQPRD